MLLVRGPDAATDLAPALRTAMQAVGDSVAVVGAGGVWHVHVHTTVPAAAIAAVATTRREQVVVRLLAAHGPADGSGLGVVAGTGSPELATAFAASGAVVLVRADGAVPLARHLVRVITDSGQRHVVVLPGDAATAAAAREAAGSLAPSGTRVEVLGARDELEVAVGLLALQGGGGGAVRVDAARAALARLRTAVVAGPELAAACAAVDDLVAGGARPAALLAAEQSTAEQSPTPPTPPTSPAPPATLTVLTGQSVDAALRTAFEAAVAERHPELAVLGAGPVAGAPAFWLGLD